MLPDDPKCIINSWQNLQSVMWEVRNNMDYEGISQQIIFPVASLQVYSSTHMHFTQKCFLTAA